MLQKLNAKNVTDVNNNPTQEAHVLQKLLVRNVSNENCDPAGGFVSGVGIDIRWQDGPLRDPEAKPASDGPQEACERPSLKSDRLSRHGEPEPEAPRHNGAFVEGVIMAAKKRLEFYQASRFACPENASALDHLNKALEALESRTSRRVTAGTEGTHQGS